MPTLADSTEEPAYLTTFFVSALTGTLGVQYDSAPASGYSVDNLVPSVPEELKVVYRELTGNHISWSACPDGDVEVYHVYRGTDPGFIPDEEALIHATSGISWRDPVPNGWGYYYKVSAVDDAGNEGPPASPMGAEHDLVTPDAKRFRLHPAAPNPLASSTTIAYDVPESGGWVTLQVFDAAGRAVRTLVDREESPGRKTMSWDGTGSNSQALASGVYFYRLQAEGFTATRKLLILR